MLKTYNGTTYYYDNFGNLIHRELADGEVQNYFYDLHDQLVKAEIFKKDGTKETWSYTYDALGRRIGKGCLKDKEVSGSLEDETRFVWDGSHLLQEQNSDGRYTYIYTDPSSYEPLAQVCNWTTEESESKQEINYFHCDQIGIPREMTDKDGNLLWFGNYTGWGRLKEETRVTDSAYQPFRLQNQYADRETGLHYNFLRYYEPDAGRFVNQDPIRLWGGDNFYLFAPSIYQWSDVLGLARSKGARATISCNKGGAILEYKGLSKNAAKNAGREQNINKNITQLYEQKAREDRNPNINGTCAEAEALSNLMEKENINSIEKLIDFIKENKCRSESFDIATGKPKAPCPKHCEPVLTFLGVAF